MQQQHFQQGDLIQLNTNSVLNLGIGTVYYNTSPSKTLFSKNHLNWWQDFPVNFYSNSGAIKLFPEETNACYFIVERVVNSPNFQGYVLLLTSQMIRHHPLLETEILESTVGEEKRLLTILRHLSREKAKKTDAILAYVPFHLANAFSLVLSSSGQNQNKQNEYLVWEKHFDSWFDWTVKLSFEQDEANFRPVKVSCHLSRDTNIYLDLQGLQIRIAYGQYFDRNIDNIAKISIHQQLSRGEQQSPEINQSLNFNLPVISVETNAAQWMIAAQIDKTSRTIQLHVTENMLVLA